VIPDATSGNWFGPDSNKLATESHFEAYEKFGYRLRY